MQQFQHDVSCLCTLRRQDLSSKLRGVFTVRDPVLIDDSAYLLK